jgi:hypothetical protein
MVASVGYGASRLTHPTHVRRRLTNRLITRHHGAAESDRTLSLADDNNQVALRTRRKQ